MKIKYLFAFVLLCLFCADASAFGCRANGGQRRGGLFGLGIFTPFKGVTYSQGTTPSCASGSCAAGQCATGTCATGCTGDSCPLSAASVKIKATPTVSEKDGITTIIDRDGSVWKTDGNVWKVN